MENPNPFYAKMELLTDEALLKVLSMKEDYQPMAILAAEEVFKNRNLSKEKVVEINAKVENENYQRDEKVRKRREKINDALNMVSVFSNGVSTAFDEKQIKGLKLLIIGLALYYLYGVYVSYPFIEMIFSLEGFNSFSIILEMIVSILIFPIGIFLLARLNKKGWIILLFIFMSKLILIVGMTFIAIYHQIDMWANPQPPSIFDGFKQQPNWALNLLIILTQGSVVWYFSKDSVMRLLKLDPAKKRFYMITTLVASIIYLAVFFSLLFT